MEERMAGCKNPAWRLRESNDHDDGDDDGWMDFLGKGKDL